jgi:hypothetical protein
VNSSVVPDAYVEVGSGEEAGLGYEDGSLVGSSAIKRTLVSADSYMVADNPVFTGIMNGADIVLTGNLVSAAPTQGGHVITRDFASASYVPYTGANANVNLGVRTLTTTGAVTGGVVTASTRLVSPAIRPSSSFVAIQNASGATIGELGQDSDYCEFDLLRARFLQARQQIQIFKNDSNYSSANLGGFINALDASGGFLQIYAYGGGSNQAHINVGYKDGGVASKSIQFNVAPDSLWYNNDLIAVKGDLGSYVPYTGATANVDLGVRTITTTGAVSTGALTAAGLVSANAGIATTKVTATGLCGFSKRELSATPITSPGNIFTQQQWDTLTIGVNDKSISGIRFLSQREASTTSVGTRLLQNLESFEIWTGISSQVKALSLSDSGLVTAGAGLAATTITTTNAITTASSIIFQNNLTGAQWQYAGVLRFVARRSGDNFELLARNDDGTARDTPLTIPRATEGTATLNRALTASGLITANGGIAGTTATMTGMVSSGGSTFGVDQPFLNQHTTRKDYVDTKVAQSYAATVPFVGTNNFDTGNGIRAQFFDAATDYMSLKLRANSYELHAFQFADGVWGVAGGPDGSIAAATSLTLSSDLTKTTGDLQIPVDKVFRIGEDVDGSWRLDVSGSQLLIQQKQSGTWVTIGDFTGV